MALPKPTQKPPPGTQLAPGFFRAPGGVYACNEGAGGVFDVSGAVPAAQILNNGLTWGAGKFGPALSFAGDPTRVLKVSSFPKATAGVYTLAAWVRCTSLTGAYQLIAANWGTTAATGEFFFGLNPSNQLVVIVAQSGGTTVTCADTTAFPANTWQPVAVVCDGATVRLYRGGVQVASVAYNGTLDTTTAHMGIGMRLNDSGALDSANSLPWHGQIDHLFLDNAAHPAADIRTLAVVPFSMFAPSLVRRYAFPGGGVSVSASASPTSVALGATSTITGTVSGYASNGAATFSDGGAGGSFGSVGTVGGVNTVTYTAASLAWQAGAVTITVTSVEDATKHGTCALTVTRAATAFYFSPSGSDTNAGTSALPLQTIAKASAIALQPGDSLLFQGGQSFSGNLVVGGSGSATAPIVVSAYGGVPTPQYHGGDPRMAYSTGNATIACGTGHGVLVQDRQYVRLSFLNVVGPGVTYTPPSTSSTTSTGSGIYFLSTASGTAKLAGLWATNCVVTGTYQGIHAQMIAASTPVGFSDLRVVGCTVHDCLTWGIRLWSTAGQAISSVFQAGKFCSDVYFGYCTAYNIWGDSANVLNNTGHGINLFNTSGGLIERCVAYTCGPANTTSGGGPALIWMASVQYGIIQDCEAHHCYNGTLNSDAVGFDLDNDCQNCVVQRCYSHDNDGTGYLTGGGGLGGTTQNNVFRYNVSQNDARAWDQAGWRVFGSVGVSVVHNNVFWCGTAGGGGGGGGFGMVGVSQHTTFIDNILVAPSGAALLTSGVDGTNSFVNNGYWRSGDTFSLAYNGTTYTSLAAFQAAGQELLNGVPVGVFADPCLVAPGGGGSDLLPARPVATMGAYDLLPWSPLIDAGVDVGAVAAANQQGDVDFHGMPNRAGAWVDIGAAEYQGQTLGAVAGARRVGMNGGI